MSCEICRLNKKGTEVHLNAKNRIDHEALRRLAAVLLTLAAIAESIARRSTPFHGIVLWLLGKAECRAGGFASKIGAGAVFAFPGAGSPVFRLGNSGEAARLAQRFRALAAVFSALSRQIEHGLRVALRHNPISLCANWRNLIRPARRVSSHHRSFTDTS
jgi:hypothetical protein